MNMKRAQRLKVLRRLSDKIEELRSLNHTHREFKEWKEEAKRRLKEFCGKDHDWVKQFEDLLFQDLHFSPPERISPRDIEIYGQDLIKAKDIFAAIIEWEERQEKRMRERESKEETP